MTEEKLNRCKECHKYPMISLGGLAGCDTSGCIHRDIFVTQEIWELIHTPDPRIAELQSQVHELERLLDESHVVAAALDTELRTLKTVESKPEN